MEQLVADNDAPSDKEKLRAIRVFICNENLQKFVRDVFQPDLIDKRILHLQRLSSWCTGSLTNMTGYPSTKKFVE